MTPELRTPPTVRHPHLPGRERRQVCRSYHLLNHLNLFGASYLAQVLATLESLP